MINRHIDNLDEKPSIILISVFAEQNARSSIA